MYDGTGKSCGAVWRSNLVHRTVKHGFEHLAQVRGYSDDQFRKLEHALAQVEPVPEELDDLLVNLGVLREEN